MSYLSPFDYVTFVDILLLLYLIFKNIVNSVFYLFFFCMHLLIINLFLNLQLSQLKFFLLANKC